MRKIHILHLSDLHIKNTFDNVSVLAYNIGESLRRNDETVDVVVVTGDIFDKPSEKDDLKKIIDEAVNFFSLLLEKINRINANQGKEPISKEDFLFVPGNHDLYKNGTYGAWSLYDKFLESFYNNNLPQQYCSKHMLIKSYPEKQVLFLGFDSNIDSEKEGENKFTGHISSEQLNLADAFFQEGNGYPEYDIVALFHHPCYLFEETGTRDTEGIINNALEVLNKLATWDVKLVLHGHKHDERQCVYRPIIGQKIYMFATNTIGASGSADHSGNIIELGATIRLKRIIARNSAHFLIEKINIRDNYEEGLLYDLIRRTDGHHDDYDNVVQMICKLYLSNKPLKLLLYNQVNRFILKNSLKHKLVPNYMYIRSHEGISDEELLEIQKILDSVNDTEIPVNTKDNLENNLNRKRRMAFALLAKFFVDLYNKIENACYVKSEDQQFNIDTSCYFVYFTLKSSSKEADAYKELDDIMEKFQVRLDEIQDFLYCIKLNIKNIFLELQGNHINDKRYCDFDASVPRLIQLLTGSNIYYHEYSFVRELVQNSIDAISFRENQDMKKFIPKIQITLGFDGNKDAFLKIRDSGIGMRREMIERYFTTLGRSFYKEYTGTRNIQYNSISNFGIGFLAVFKPCRKIIINTKHFKEKIHHTLEISSNKGHFTICSNSQSEFDDGTEIKCYFMEQDVNFEEIINYIKEIMLDIKYDIFIEVNGSEIPKIDARAIRKPENIVFIPFNEDNKDHREWSNDYQNKTLMDTMERYRHGVLIRPELTDQAGIDILSAGIKLRDAKLEEIFGKYDNIPKGNPELKFIKMTMNFPPNWLDIDVSREKANGVRVSYIRNIAAFKKYIYDGLKYLVRKATEHSDLKISFFSDALTLMKYFQETDDINNESETLALEVQFKKRGINFKLGNNKEILFHTWKIDINLRLTDDEGKRVYNTIIDLFNEGLSHDEVSAILHMSAGSEDLKKGRQILQKLGLNAEYVEDRYLPVISALFLESKAESRERDGIKKDLRSLVVETILNNCTVGEIGKESLFSIFYDDCGHPELTVEFRKLDHIIESIAYVYGEKSHLYKYDFIWKHIIKEIQGEYKFYFSDEDVLKIPDAIENEYLSLNRKTKNLYFSSDNSLIDCYTIAACYMGALLSIPDEKIKWKESKDPSAKYNWILDVGLQLVYIWRLSEYLEFHKEICETPPRKGKFEFPNGDISRKKYVILLASHEKKTFDVLCFAELLHWLDIYNKGKFFS